MAGAVDGWMAGGTARRPECWTAADLQCWMAGELYGWSAGKLEGCWNTNWLDGCTNNAYGYKRTRTLTSTVCPSADTLSNSQALRLSNPLPLWPSSVLAPPPALQPSTHPAFHTSSCTYLKKKEHDIMRNMNYMLAITIGEQWVHRPPSAPTTQLLSSNL